jgi:hypothetical protein
MDKIKTTAWVKQKSKRRAQSMRFGHGKEAGTLRTGRITPIS